MSSSVPPVSPVTRRIFLYWVLLLVPTLVIGAGAILLLRKEHARLAEQGAYAAEARQAAVAARARLIAESAELLVGDVQALLLDTLAEGADGSVERFMGGWAQANPLVRTAFRVDSKGELQPPATSGGDEEARGFARRFGNVFRATPPWAERSVATPGSVKLAAPSADGSVAPGPLSASAAGPKDASAAELKKEQAADYAARREVDANVAQVQSARRNVQELFNVSKVKAAEEAAAEARLADEAQGRRAAAAGAVGVAEKRGAGGAEKRSVDLASAPAASGAPRPAGSDASGTRGASGPRAQRAREATAQRGSAAAPSATAAVPTPVRAEKVAATRRGWTPLTVDGKLHLIAWVQLADATVRGVEVEMAALVSRLASTLPAETESGEGFALRDANGNVVHQVGAVTVRAGPALKVPLAASLLPGWEVAGYLAAGERIGNGGSGFFWVGTLLVGIFVAAILAGGSLLLWQARRSEEEAAQKTSFVANVSHEFKTPLTTIRLYSELLEQGRVRDREQGNEYLRTIGRETQRLARLVNNALDFSRLEQGQKKFARERMNLGAELARLLDTHAPRVAEAGLELKRELPAEGVEITTDRDALEQIVLNLIDNACKYAGGSDGGAAGEVTVALKANAKGGAEVIVGDRGPGVPAEHRERIFEKFHRVDDALTAEKTGAGLGLSIARQLARGLGGELRYRPREGGGAEFILEIP